MIEKLYFTQMSKRDIKEINNWQRQFDVSEFMSIYKFIFENDLFGTLKQVIQYSYEFCKIGDDERKLAISIKNSTDEIVAFIICQEFNITKSEPELFLQYLVVKPNYQNKHIGSQIVSMLPDEIENFTGVRPQTCFGYIDKSNFASQNLFKNSDFLLIPLRNSNFYKASGRFLAKEKNDE